MKYLFAIFLLMVLFVSDSQAQSINECGITKTRCWTTATRPASPSPGTFGYNKNMMVMEWWDGSTWSQFSGQMTKPQFSCDIIALDASAKCVAAYSVTRRMFWYYTGSLFQLTRASDSTTQDIGTTSNGTINFAAVNTFCLGTSCYFSKIYDQVTNNTLPQATVSRMAPWMIYSNGLPIVETTQNIPTVYYRNRLNTNNMPLGSTLSTTFNVRATNIWGTTGDFGRAEQNSDANLPCSTGHCTLGAMWENAYTNYFGNNINGTLGFGVDNECGSGLPNCPDGGEIVFAPTSFPNVTMILTKVGTSPKQQLYAFNAATTASVGSLGVSFSPTPAVEAGLSLGEGGDGSPGSSEFFEGAVINGFTTTATDQALVRNISAFYGTAQSTYAKPPAPIDIAWNSGCGGILCDSIMVTAGTSQATGSHLLIGNPQQYGRDRLINGNTAIDVSAISGGFWGLRCGRASYTGYVADIIRASDSATLSVGCDTNRNFDNTTASAFCAATTCCVSRLYNQALIHLKNDTQPSTFDLVQATPAKQPCLVFGGPNGRTVMSGNGSQLLCSNANIGVPGNGYTMGVVAKRTAGIGAPTAALSYNGPNGGYIGFATTTNTAMATTVSGTLNLNKSATDNLFHSIMASIVGNPTAATPATYELIIDNGTPTTLRSNVLTADSNLNCLFSASFGGFPPAVDANVMTGQIAEAFIAIANLDTYESAMTPAQKVSVFNNQRTYYGLAF